MSRCQVVLKALAQERTALLFAAEHLRRDKAYDHIGTTGGRRKRGGKQSNARKHRPNLYRT